MNTEINTGIVKSTARKLGFDYCGIAKAEQLNEDAVRLERWLKQGMHGEMKYMEGYFDMRIDPSKLVPGAKSVITLLLNYFPKEHQPEGLPKISKYAYGKDYHQIIKDKLHHLIYELQESIGQINGRGFVDSAPVLERSWAKRSGLGWIGKNGNLINKKQGSFFFIATLITDLELHYEDKFIGDFCGSCNRCVEACPTEAILPERIVDGSKCISYFTIELKDALIPEKMKGKFDNWLFGCDVCQDVCPWNRFSKPHTNSDLQPTPEIFNFTSKDWEELSREQFSKIFMDSSIKRTKYEGILRNIKFLENK